MKRPMVMEQPDAAAFAVGDRVYLKGCPFGEPGRVLRLERGKVAVLWPDLGPTYIGRHRPDALRVTRLAVETPRKACESRPTRIEWRGAR